MVSDKKSKQNSFKIKRQANNVFPSDVVRTVVNSQWTDNNNSEYSERSKLYGREYYQGK